ncbi:Histidine kinase [Parafilimonas terrae]|uniref:Histidine kinase n=2 Tax=Parafilimonas terrae TaxID=1465490 RepID=A0A1I5XBS5_9BACT|nr:Histidine kinase [Parafilimonas terrae]
MLQQNKKESQVKMRYRLEHELLLSQLETQEYSFSQVSMALHDNIGQLLSTTKLLLGMTAMGLAQPPDTLKTAEHTLAKAIADLRSLSKTLHNGWLPHFNFISHLEAEKERINARGMTQVAIISNNEELLLEPGVQIILFRVVYEALQHITKHCSAKCITIRLKGGLNLFEIEIALSDIAYPLKKNTVSSNMQRRIQLLGGTIKWQYNEINKYLIQIKIPVNNKEIA